MAPVPSSYTHGNDKAVYSHHRLLTTVAAMTDNTPRYALEGAVFVAGAAVQWLRDGLHLFRTSAEVERLAKESNPAEPILFVPGFVGLGAPHWVPEARGVIFGLTRATTGAELARAALEGVAFQVADLIEAAERDVSHTDESASQSLPQGTRTQELLRVDGGMAENDWFLKCQADVLGRPVARAAQSESTALGAAFLATIGAQLADIGKLGAIVSAARRFEPTVSAQERNQKLTKWRKAVQTVIGFYEK